MIKTHTDGMHYHIPKEWNEKLKKYDRIVTLLESRSKYSGNRETCNMIREIINENQKEG